PHHGALRTAVQGYVANKQPSEFNFEIIQTFAKVVSPHSVGASAGPWNTHHHPIQEVLDCFEGYVDKNEKDHTYVSYVFKRPDNKTHEGWVTYTDVKHAEWCTIDAIGDTAEASMTEKKATKENKGPFVYGDVEFAFGGKVEKRPEEMVTFHPRGIMRIGPADEPVDYAPAP